MNNKSIAPLKILATLLVLLFTGNAKGQPFQKGWKQLFNGRDLHSWDSYLRYPTPVGFEKMNRDSLPPAFGLNNDPRGVFKVEDGMIHISGEIWGALTTREEYSNYHLRCLIKWGEKKYYPKDRSSMDGGILYHASDRFDYAFDCWMRSMEMQIQEHDMGDFWPVGAGLAEFMVKPDGRTIHKDTGDQYDSRYAPQRHSNHIHYGHVWRSGDFESAHGQWTTAELVTRGADAVYIINGFVVNRLFNIFRDDLKEQVTKGKIQLQSEGGEHFYKKVEIRPVSFTVSRPLLTVKDSTILVSGTVENNLVITNTGGPVEIIAAELIGDNIEEFQVKLPSLPLIIGIGQTITLPVNMRPGYKTGNQVKFRLETVLGPVQGFSVNLLSR
ncbi:MAG: DUF1080 domain-containing protein [Ferruginibacter sp.]